MTQSPYLTKGIALGNIIIENTESNRVEVNSYLLDTVRETILKELNFKYRVSNSAIITFALLQLLDPETKNDVIETLSNNGRFSYFDVLSSKFSTQTSSKNTPQGSINSRDLQRLTESINELKTLEHANLTLNAWLAQNRMGLFTDELPLDTRDVYMLLRSDNTVGIVDEALKAGLSEESRQNQKKL